MTREESFDELKKDPNYSNYTSQELDEATEKYLNSLQDGIKEYEIGSIKYSKSKCSIKIVQTILLTTALFLSMALSLNNTVDIDGTFQNSEGNKVQVSDNGEKIVEHNQDGTTTEMEYSSELAAEMRKKAVAEELPYYEYSTESKRL